MTIVGRSPSGPRAALRSTEWLMVLLVSVVLLVVPARAAADAPTPVAGAPTGVLEGTVTDERGNPLAGVRAVVMHQERVDETTSRTVETGETAPSDADGHYRVTGLEDRTDYVVAFFLDGYQRGGLVPQVGQPQGIVAISGGGTTVRDGFLVERSARVAGTVATWSGTPIEGATVQVGWESVTTDADGRFSVAVIPGDQLLIADAPGFRYIGYWQFNERGAIVVTAERGVAKDLGTLRLRRFPTERCVAEDGTPWITTEANGLLPPGPTLPREQHLCPDVALSELPATGGEASPARVGIPPRVLPGSIAPVAAKAPSVVSQTRVSRTVLSASPRVVVRGSTFEVRSSCTVRCTGRIVATVRRGSGTRARTVVAARATVRAGTGDRRHRLALTAIGRSAVRAGGRGILVSLRWDAGAGGTDATGPRVRLVRGR